MRLAVFDLDGTLADTFPAMQAAFSAGAGRAVADDELLRLFGPGAGPETHILASLGAPVPEALEAWYARYRAAHDGLDTFPGMR